MSNLQFLYKMELSHRAKVVFMYLYDRKNKDNECWPAINTIARELKMSRSTVIRATNDLRKSGLLTTNKRKNYFGGDSSLMYKIHLPRPP